LGKHASWSMMISARSCRRALVDGIGVERAHPGDLRAQLGDETRTVLGPRHARDRVDPAEQSCDQRLADSTAGPCH
jgi:hypothetical protein